MPSLASSCLMTRGEQLRNDRHEEGRPTRQDDAPLTTPACRTDILLRAAKEPKEKTMSYDGFFGALRADQQKLVDHGLSPYPTDAELVGYVIDVDDRVCALYKAFRMEAYRDYRGIWRVGPLGVNPVRYE